MKNKLNLSPWEFDQSPSGWRGVDKKEGPEKATLLIMEYISRNREQILNPQEGEKKIPLSIMYFHAGQLLASIGKNKYSEALEAFQQSFKVGSECWNAYVSATIGFLEGDKDKIQKAIKTIESSSEKEKDKKSGNLKIVKNFLKVQELGMGDYNTAYNMPREEV